ncbi:MAG: universal stress protein [SAR202 cluster bacterium]|nr:universal stress protein [SAR202 cluster bacterium]
MALKDAAVSGGRGYPVIDRHAAEAKVKAEAAAYLDGVAKRLKSSGVKTEINILSGPPAQTIVAYTEANPQDLVVLTTHGASGFTRWLMGSVAETLVRSSRDPVLIVPSKKS